MTPDGNTIIVVDRSEKTDQDVLAVSPIKDKDPLAPLLQTAAAEINPVLSPDGKWLAYQSNESGRSEV